MCRIDHIMRLEINTIKPGVFGRHVAELVYRNASRRFGKCSTGLRQCIANVPINSKIDYGMH